jgi:hypothetical protein
MRNQTSPISLSVRGKKVLKVVSILVLSGYALSHFLVGIAWGNIAEYSGARWMGILFLACFFFFGLATWMRAVNVSWWLYPALAGIAISQSFLVIYSGFFWGLGTLVNLVVLALIAIDFLQGFPANRASSQSPS